MSYRKFGKNDVLINTLKAHPRSEFYIYSSSIYYNNRGRNQGKYNGEARMVPDGFINLYEYNIDKGTIGGSVASENKYIEPFISKDSSRISLSMTTESLSSTDWGTEFGYGDKITGSYPQFTSIKREYISTPSASSDACKRGTFDCAHNYSYMSLRPLLNHYGTLSEHYKVNNGIRNLDSTNLNLIHIPSIFYGNKIKPGTVSLRWYVTGTLLAELTDHKQNGELIQVGSTIGSELNTLSGSVQGVVLYNEGFILLTGSTSIRTGQTMMLRAGESTRENPSWRYWGAGARDGVTYDSFGGSRPDSFLSASFGMSFEGETATETVTMYARAPRGKVNYSNNPTFIKYDQQLLEFTSSHVYQENRERLIKNIVSSSFGDYNEKFRRQVYISKIGIYDDDKNLIGIATLADPVRKDENEDYVFKIKMDM